MPVREFLILLGKCTIAAIVTYMLAWWVFDQILQADERRSRRLEQKRGRDKYGCLT